MSLFIWKPEYSIGVPEIDAQHKELFRMADDLHNAMSTGTAKSSVPKLLDELIRYTCQHFVNEERLQRESGYPGYAAHHQEHEQLKKQVLELQAKVETRRVVVTIEVMQFLSDWLRHHIKGSDQKVAMHLKQHLTAAR